MQEGICCYRIPTIVIAPNGDVIAAAIDERVQDGGDLRTSSDINRVVKRNSHSGRTWSKIETKK